MEKEFVPHEESLELKKLGFDEVCLAMQTIGGLQLFSQRGFAIPKGGYTNTELEIDSALAVPTFSQVFRWFREKHGLGHMINGIGYESFIMNIGGILHIFNGFEFNTYEEAELNCLRKLIDIVKGGKE